MPPKKVATATKATPKKPAPAKKAPVAKKAAAKKAPAKKASTKKAGQKRARSPTPSESESDSSDVSDDDTLKAPPAKRSKREASKSLAEEDEEDAPLPQAKASKKATPDKDTVNLFGKFDIYDKDLPCLAPGYDKGSPDFEKLLELMKEFQAKPDFTARVAIPESLGTSDGAFEIQGFEDPMSGEQYEISLEGIQLTGKDKSTVKAKLSVDGGCGLSSSSGTLSLHRCWTKDLDEIFECIININVSYSGLYRRKGHGSGMRLNMKCWAIRARKNASGEEIGLTLN